MPKKRQYSKEAIDNAVKFVQEGGGSCRGAAIQFGVPRSSIQFKLRNPTSKFKSGPDPVLSKDEENELCDFIIQSAKRGFPLKKEDVQACVEDFLRVNPRPNPFRNGKPGDVWFKAFLNRHPMISIRTSEGVTNASACVSEQDIRKWFLEIRQYFEEENLMQVVQDPRRVFNADETGRNKTEKVLAQKGAKNVYQIEKGSAKENITVLFTFSAAGQVFNPLIIYPLKRIHDRVGKSVPSGWGIGRSESGWMTADVFYDFIANCFHRQLLLNNVPLPVILFVDGHKTHLTIEVSQLCRSLQIHLVALYPNATRILQPADVAAFQPIKAGWKMALREWHAANNYETNLTKENFAPLLKTVVDSCTKKNTLVNGFRVCDPDNVDYSKCLQSESGIEPRHELIASMAMKISDSSMPVLSYSDFCGIVSKPIVEKCELANTVSVEEFDDNFKAIYRLWQKFHELGEPNNNNTEKTSLPDTDKSHCNQDKASNFQHGGTEDNTILNESTGEFLQQNSEAEKNLETNANIVPERNEHPRELQMPTSSTHINKQQLQESIHIDPNKKINIISNVLLSDYLKAKKVPQPPKRQGKRQVQKIPFALTSDSYVELIEAKQLKKQEEEAAKEERKRLREEKKAQKENVPKKRTKKVLKEKNEASTSSLRLPLPTQNVMSEQATKAKKYVICCDSCLSPITKGVLECSQCAKTYHQNCIPVRHRIHIPTDEDDSFLCHMCYKESNTDSSDDNDIDLFRSLYNESKKQGF